MQTPKTQKLLWDNKTFSKISPQAEQLTSRFAEMLLRQAGIPQQPLTEPVVILDNACGTGVLTKSLHEMLQGTPAELLTVTCGDLADAMVQTISERIVASGWKNTQALKIDAQDTKLASSQFTHVFTNFGPMLFPNASAMLSECNRILQPHGICAFTTWKTVAWMEDVQAAFASMADLPACPSRERFAAAMSKGQWWDECYIREQLVHHGFDNIKIETAHNVSVAENMDELRLTLRPILAIVYSFWTKEERQVFANQETDERVVQWFNEKYHGGPVNWNWVALITTCNKCT